MAAVSGYRNRKREQKTPMMKIKKKQPYRRIYPTKVLVKVFSEILSKYGLTVVILSQRKESFTFKIKECNSRIVFDFDGLCIGIVVLYRGNCYDFISIIPVPFVSIDKGRNAFYAHWWGQDRYYGPHSSIEILLKKYITRYSKKWIQEYSTPNLKLNIYRIKGGGRSWARLIDSKNPPKLSSKIRKEDKECLIASIPFWKELP